MSRRPTDYDSSSRVVVTFENSKHFLEHSRVYPRIRVEPDESQAEALVNAREALNVWLAANCDRNLDIPKPAAHKRRSFHAVEVDLPIAFAIGLRRLRSKKRLMQAQVAKKLGVSQQAYAKLESPTKTNPSLATLQKIARSLDAEIDLRVVS